MKLIFLIFFALFIINAKSFAQQTISITKNTKDLKNIPNNDGVKEVSIQKELIPYNPNLKSNKNIEKISNNYTQTQENQVIEIQVTKNLVPIQEKPAFSVEKKAVFTNDNNHVKSTYNEVILEPVPLIPLKSNK